MFHPDPASSQPAKPVTYTY